MKSKHIIGKRVVKVDQYRLGKEAAVAGYALTRIHFDDGTTLLLSVIETEYEPVVTAFCMKNGMVLS